MSQNVKDGAIAENKLPRHVAIIMDGNGRWAQQKYLPRTAGHRAGLEAARTAIQSCNQRGIEVLTLFAFGRENWQRPAAEVGYLMELFLTAINAEIKKLHKNNIQLRFIGDCTRFNKKLRASIEKAQELTAQNTGLKLVIAVDYSGRWDIVEASRKLALQVAQGLITLPEITENLFQSFLSLHDLPEPDLFIRTSGERRISNFLLWQLAYTELYFTDILWPDFTLKVFEDALDFYTSRQRRFGCTSEQVENSQSA